MLTFGLIGIVGGEAAGRLRQALARFANADTFDEWSLVFNQRYAHTALTRALAAFDRYHTPFTAILLTLAPSLTADLGPKRVRTLVRAVSNHLRGDVRMVDEVARLDDGRFLSCCPTRRLRTDAASPGGSRQESANFSVLARSP